MADTKTAADYKTLKLNKRFIAPLMSGEKYVTRRETDITYTRSSVDETIWYYQKTNDRPENFKTTEGEIHYIPKGAELLVSVPQSKIIERAPIQAGETILFIEPLAGGEYRPIATVTVTCVSIQHVQDITEEDARKEGFGSRYDFSRFIESVHPGCWQLNNSVWVYEFDNVKAWEGAA
ncbi:ASCH domain-containing protein [Salmonella enterica subsp. enterica]|uniref:ASCH domain-containing protein n=1 Tax=Salmonella enterica subsp. enterica serovar Kisarawe TaxID=2517242 RepID=A0A5X8YTF7_SALET|nr:ASCH domain-containing protein [Salmonella enterica]EBY9399060.1 ASCH domain-containing protein [Salmonella enterica subsp. enterica serovar Kisarawe]EDS6472302.1 ASCH domain-containing protein [Salmonella enterica subsp. enterica]EDU6184691.1 ASCH domain-containing protein [Salmonella enterica subsp. houtenae serovar 44:z4,z23:-]EBT7936867.1 ASCH domain-containing protein [Salmonella enterica]